MGRYNIGASTNIIYIASDCFFGGIAFLLAIIYSRQYSDLLNGSYITFIITFMVIFVLANKEARLYNITTFFYTDRIVRSVSRSFLIASGVTSTLIFYVGNADTDLTFYVCFLLTVYILLILSAFMIHFFLRNSSRYAPRTLFVGKKEYFARFKDYLLKCNMNINLVGHVGMDQEVSEGYIGNTVNLEHLIHDNGIDQIFMMYQSASETEIQQYINMCMEMGVTARVIIHSNKMSGAQSYISSVGTYPMLTYHTVTLNKTSRAVKRGIDIFGGVVAILLFAPIMLVTAVAVKLESPGPVIFKQERVGMNGRHFYMYKFRSMCQDAESKKEELMEQNEMDNDFMFKIKNDPRVTRVGKFIRSMSIDELPQFFNVLIGNMSLVGTRPPTLDEVDRYERNHWRRISIKPGITGMWQVKGRSKVTDFDEIVEMDTEYIDNWNVLMDFRIMAKTVIQVLTRKGAY